jgi:hypothetical protein
VETTKQDEEERKKPKARGGTGRHAFLIVIKRNFLQEKAMETTKQK